MQFPISLSSSSYLRTFEAEIDVTAENEIFVRGVMSDHRFAFEHTWTVRTPAGVTQTLPESESGEAFPKASSQRSAICPEPTNIC